MLFNFDIFLYVTLNWLYYGIIPDKRFALFLRSIKLQESEHNLFLLYLASTLEGMINQYNLQQRLRWIYQQFLQLHMFMQLIHDVNMDEYINQIILVIDYLQFFIHPSSFENIGIENSVEV